VLKKLLAKGEGFLTPEKGDEVSGAHPGAALAAVTPRVVNQLRPWAHG